MSSAHGPAPGLPVRMPRPRQPGRHRRPEPLAAPQDAPTLILAVPGAPSTAVRQLAEEVLSIARSELAGLRARVGYLLGEGDADSPTVEDQYPSLHGQLARTAAEHPADSPAAVVVPLLTGPHAAVLAGIREAVAQTAPTAQITDVLGPHPLLAEALHVRLSEAGLARADRARLFTVATAADGIILAAVGGEEGVQAANVTGLLLSARLAVPVLAAALDVDGGVAHAAEQLRSAGSGRLAVAPYLIGPECEEGLLAAAAAAANCSAAEPLGAYPTLGQLVVNRYGTLLGIAPQQCGAPTH